MAATHDAHDTESQHDLDPNDRGSQQAQDTPETAGLAPWLLDSDETIELGRGLVTRELAAWHDELARPERALLPHAEMTEARGEPAPYRVTPAPWPQVPTAGSLAPLDLLAPPAVSPEEQLLFDSVAGQSMDAQHATNKAQLGAFDTLAGDALSDIAADHAAHHEQWVETLHAAQTLLDQTHQAELQRVIDVLAEAGLALAGALERGDATLDDVRDVGRAEIEAAHVDAQYRVEMACGETRRQLDHVEATAPDVVDRELEPIWRTADEREIAAFSALREDRRVLDKFYDVEPHLGYSFGDEDAPKKALRQDVSGKLMRAQADALETTGIPGAIAATVEAGRQTLAPQWTGDLVERLIPSQREAVDQLETELGLRLTEEARLADEQLVAAVESSRDTLRTQIEQGHAELEQQGLEMTEAVDVEADAVRTGLDALDEETTERQTQAAHADHDVVVQIVQGLQTQLGELAGRLLPPSAVEAWMQEQRDGLQVELDRMRQARSQGSTTAREALQGLVESAVEQLDLQGLAFEARVVTRGDEVTAALDAHVVGHAETLATDAIEVATRLVATAEPVQDTLAPVAPETQAASELAAAEELAPAAVTHLDASLAPLESLRTPLRLAVDEGQQAAYDQAARHVETQRAALHGESESTWVEDDVVVGVLRKLSAGEIAYLKYEYDHKYSDHHNRNGRRDEDCDWVSPIYFDLWEGTSGSDYHAAMAYLEHDREAAIGHEIDAATGLVNDDEERLEDVLRNASNEEIASLDATRVQAIHEAADGWSEDGPVYAALLDVSVTREQRLIHADAASILRETEWGYLGDQEKVENILTTYEDPAARAQLRTSFESLAGEPLTSAVRGLVDTDSSALLVSLSRAERDADAVRVARIIKAGEYAGTREKDIAEALEDPQFAARWKAAEGDRALQEQLVRERIETLDSHLRAFNDGPERTIEDYIDSEMGTESVTWDDVCAGRVDDLDGVDAERLMTQRLLETGQCEADLLIRAAVDGGGTNVDLLKKALGGRSWHELESIRRDYELHWREVAWSWVGLDEPELLSASDNPEGRLCDELSGQDWFEIKMLLLGEAGTPRQMMRRVELAYAHSHGDFSSAALDFYVDSQAGSDLRRSYHRFVRLYHALDDSQRDEPLREHPELASFARGVVDDAASYTQIVDGFTGAVTTAIELIGAVVVEVLSAGAATPWLAAVVGNLVVGGTQVAINAAMKGDRYLNLSGIGVDALSTVTGAAAAGLGKASEFGKLIDESMGAREALAFKGLEWGLTFQTSEKLATSVVTALKTLERVGQAQNLIVKLSASGELTLEEGMWTLLSMAVSSAAAKGGEAVGGATGKLVDETAETPLGALGGKVFEKLVPSLGQQGASQTLARLDRVAQAPALVEALRGANGSADDVERFLEAVPTPALLEMIEEIAAALGL